MCDLCFGLLRPAYAKPLLLFLLLGMGPFSAPHCHMSISYAPQTSHVINAATTVDLTTQDAETDNKNWKACTKEGVLQLRVPKVVIPKKPAVEIPVE